jgi:hypothetical protein
MTGWERLGIGSLSQGFLSGRLSPSAALDDAPATLLARPDFGELFLGRSARTPQPAAPGRHLPQTTTGPAVTAVGEHQASHDED